MPNIYVKLDGENIIEASKQILKGGKKITCTKQECDNIFNYYDATCDGLKVTSTSQGQNSQDYSAMKAFKQQQKELEEQEP